MKKFLGWMGVVSSPLAAVVLTAGTPKLLAVLFTIVLTPDPLIQTIVAAAAILGLFGTLTGVGLLNAASLTA